MTENIVGKLSAKLKKLRKSSNMTLDQLAKKSGVSRSMLSQIERGDANPTIATLFNLSQALGLELTELVGDDEGDKNFIDYIKLGDIPHFNDVDAGSSLKILSPPEMAGQVEWYELTLEKDGGLISSPHRDGAVEHLTILSGSMRVRAGNLVQTLKMGEIARYNGDVNHSITNVQTDEHDVATAILVVIGA